MVTEFAALAAPSEPAATLTVRGVSKSFPGVQALTALDFDVRPGEVHALVGENGAGKSTLMRIIAGVEQPDTGDVSFGGESLIGIDEHRAGALGIGMVHQERSLVPELSVAENIFAGRQPTHRLGGIRWRDMNRRARELLASLRVRIDPGTRVGELAPADQQMVEIAKALSRDLRLLILDEPTAPLTLTETEHLFGVVRELRVRGVAVVYISHRLGEVFELADRVTVLKDGSVTGVRDVTETSENELIRLMVGRDLVFARDPVHAAADARDVLVLEGIASPPAVIDASLRVRRGEIVCLAGLIGSGRSEVCETVFGVRAVESGRITYMGRPLRPRDPGHATRLGIAMVPEDRKDAGLFLELDIASNVTASSLGKVSRRGFVSRRRAAQLSARLVEQLHVRTPSLAERVGNLSGGNQQKVLLAKWLAVEPRLLIVDEPTRGVDVSARAEIYDLLRALAHDGIAVLVVSSDLPEVLTLAHRIVVMHEGRTVGEIDGDEADEEQVVRLASSG